MLHPGLHRITGILNFIFGFLIRSIKRFIKHDMIERSGYVAFLAIISILPFMIFTLSLAGFVDQSEFGIRAIEYLYFITPRELQDLIQPIFSQFTYGKIPFLTFSTIILIYSASAVIQATRKGFQRIFIKDEVSNQILFRIQSIFLMLVLCFSLYFLGAIAILIPFVQHFVREILEIDIANFFLYKKILEYSSNLITFFCILIFYKTLTPRIVPFKIHCFGAFMATFIMIPTARMLKFYMQHAANYNLIYGSLSSIIITIIALQIFSAIFFWGAELNGVLFKYYKAQK